MHPQAFDYVGRFATGDPLTVIEIGSRQVNLDKTGVIRSHFPHASWIGLDLYAGRGVDIVCNAEHYRPESLVDLVICCEVLEHASNWRELIAVGASWLKPSGRLIITCAGPGREEHSAIDGGSLRAGEYYENRTAEEVAIECTIAGLACESIQSGTDTYAMMMKS